MGNMRRELSDWWEGHGKILSFRILVLLLFLAIAGRQYEPFQQFIPEEKFLLLFVGPLLFLMLEIILSVRDEPTERKIYRLVKSDQALLDLKPRLAQARTLDIVCSSTESIFLPLRDALLGSSVHCRIIFRNPKPDSEEQIKKLQNYERLWTEIGLSNPNFQVDFRYSSNHTMRMYVLDRRLVYFSFYKWDGKKYWGHNVDMISPIAGTQLENYLIDIATNWFDREWQQASRTMF